MGNSDSKNIPQKSFTPDVEVIKNKQPSQLGEVKLVRDRNTGQEMNLKEINLQNKGEFETQLKYYNTRLNNPHPNLVNLIGYTTDHHSAFCSEHYRINLFLDSLSTTLEDSLSQKIKTNEPFSEVELQLITEHLVTILGEFQKKDIAHGDICPASVYVTEEAYKLCDPTFETQKGSNGISKVILLGAKPLLAPELVKQIPKQDVEIRTNKFKADVFSLGATLLSLATLKRSEELYNYDKGTINVELLEKRLIEVEKSYSPVLVGILRELLTIDERLRPDFLHFRNRLHIGESIKVYNETNKLPISSYAKVPYVKIANEVIKNSPNQSPVKLNGSNSVSQSQSQSQYDYGVSLSNRSPSKGYEEGQFTNPISYDHGYDHRIDNVPVTHSNYNNPIQISHGK